MKKTIFVFSMFILVICFLLGSSLEAQVIGIQWNTFLGCLYDDYGLGIISDSAGNIYVTGGSADTWGSPISPYTGDKDAFVAKLDSDGNLLWNTFIGGTDNDYGRAITLDNSGNICVSGFSYLTWGSPVNPHTGVNDILVFKLDASGNLLWHTFLGSSGTDSAEGITTDSTGNIFAAGRTNGTWGTPILAYSGGEDTFVAKLNSTGSLLWNTFLGSSNHDFGYGIASDSAGNVYAAGYSYATWGSPLNPFDNFYDAFVAKLDTNGNLLWHTFVGGSSYDRCHGITSDSSGNIAIVGFTYAGWGNPVNPHSAGGDDDAFVATLDNNGNPLWHTFLGSGDGHDEGYAVTSDSSGNIYVTGSSYATWGNPINPLAADDQKDVFIAQLSRTGTRLWNTFLGSANEDYGNDITTDSNGNIYTTGNSVDSGWGNPINPHAGDYDAFVVKITPEPIPDIKANGSDGPISITQSDTLQIKVSLISYGFTDKADWWISANTPFGWYYYDFASNKWKPGKNVTHQGRLMDLNPKTVLNTSGLKTGNYTFYFGVDTDMDGEITNSSLYYDQVKITVTSD